ncbi:MAG: YicC/YloC family endoribonuclease, partial [Myxococcota bacterium]|nr:YicC/YloC family endoribonuclease [Myxococcota bacterium]MEC8424428.1 YicC/YloC family endoribonuclease [Myxococcota bacterium]
MNSMTGYGRGEATNGDLTVVVELKSVNNRFRDLNVRMPRSYLVLESRVQQVLRDALQRGRVDVFVRRSAVEGGPSVQADPVLAERYYNAMAQVAKRLARQDEDIPLASVLAQPGVLTAAEAETDALAEWT